MNVKKIMMLCLLSCICMSSQAQSDEEIRRFTVGNYEFGLRADGRLFVSDDERPGLQTVDGVSLMNGMDFMITGLDPSGNYKTSGYMPTLDDSEVNKVYSGAYDWQISDFVFRDFIHVTREEVEAHYLDYKEDGVINDTIASILYWPAVGNVHAQEKYGVLPSSSNFKLNYWDDNANGIYEPLQGEYPLLEYNTVPEDYVITFFSTIRNESFSSIPTNYALAIYSLDCYDDNDNNVEDILFIDWYILSTTDQDIRKSNSIVSMDMALGTELNDYIAYDTTSRSLHVYDEPSGDSSGVFSVYAYEPIVVWENDSLVTYWPDRVLHYENEGLLVGPQTQEQLFGHFMESKWNDGTARTFGANGYPVNASDTILAHIMFPGDPRDDSSWNEISATNSAGQRNVSILGNLGVIQPSQLTRLKYAISYTDSDDGLPDFEYSRNRVEDIVSIFRYNIGLECPSIPTTSSTVQVEKESVIIYPNPASGSIYFESDYTFQKVMIYDMMGRHIRTIKDPVSPFDFHQSGMYLFQFYDESRMVQQKLLHSDSN